MIFNINSSRGHTGSLLVCQMSTILRQERLNWYGHIRRREEDNLSRKKMMEMVAAGKTRRGRPRLRWTDNTREDIYIYINLRRSRYCLWVDVCGWMFVAFILHLLILGKCYAVHINASSL